MTRYRRKQKFTGERVSSVRNRDDDWWERRGDPFSLVYETRLASTVFVHRFASRLPLNANSVDNRSQWLLRAAIEKLGGAKVYYWISRSDRRGIGTARIHVHVEAAAGNWRRKKEKVSRRSTIQYIDHGCIRTAIRYLSKRISHSARSSSWSATALQPL